MWSAQGKPAAAAELDRQDRLRKRDEDIAAWQGQREVRAARRGGLRCNFVQVF